MNRLVLMLSLTGALSWGFWALFADVATRSMEPESAMVVSYVTAVFVAGGYIVYRGTDVFGADPTGIGFAVAGGVASGVGAVAYYAALHLGNAAIATTITAMYFVVAAVLGVLLLGESLEPTDVAGIGFAAVAIILIAR